MSFLPTSSSAKAPIVGLLVWCGVCSWFFQPLLSLGSAGRLLRSIGFLQIGNVRAMKPHQKYFNLQLDYV